MATFEARRFCAGKIRLMLFCIGYITSCICYYGIASRREDRNRAPRGKADQSKRNVSDEPPTPNLLAPHPSALPLAGRGGFLRRFQPNPEHTRAAPLSCDEANHEQRTRPHRSRQHHWQRRRPHRSSQHRRHRTWVRSLLSPSTIMLFGSGTKVAACVVAEAAASSNPASPIAIAVFDMAFSSVAPPNRQRTYSGPADKTLRPAWRVTTAATA